MLVELNFMFISSLLVVYALWVYRKKRERSILHLAICFALLTCSTALLFLNSLVWFPATRITVRLVELTVIGLYAGFAASLVLVLRRIVQH